MTLPTKWRKSSFSAGLQNCVELANAGSDVLMRDSKHPNNGHLTLSPTALAELVTSATNGDLDQLA